MRSLLRLFFLLLAAGFLGWASWAYLSQSAVASKTAAPAAAPSGADRADAAPRVSASRSIEMGEVAIASAGPGGAPDPAAVASALKDVKIAYNKPPTMRLNRPTDVTLFIDASGSADLKALLKGYEGEAAGGTIPGSSTMSAALSGPGFDIERRTPERQGLSLSAPNQWEWRVTPTEAGERPLTLKIFAYVGEAAQPLQTFQDVILVSVSPIDQAVDIAKTAHPVIGVVAGAVSLSIAAFGFVRRRRGGKGL